MERLCLACLCLLTWSGVTSAGGNGAPPKPRITVLDEIEDGVLLQCEIEGASPKPKVEWWDSSGEVLPDVEYHVRERGGSYHVTLKALVTRTSFYRCVAVHENSRQVTFDVKVVLIRGKHVEKMSNQYKAVGNVMIIGLMVLVALATAAAVGILVQKCIKKWKRDPTAEPREHVQLNNQETHNG
ncbi:butyrophilin-like protein 1 [Chaetodon auriga]|uniref:butyrophilin-like protein 1 n=1 Tax=Chaetodon auriga TaxID=39042 RepID=UPI004032C18E